MQSEQSVFDEFICIVLGLLSMDGTSVRKDKLSVIVFSAHYVNILLLLDASNIDGSRISPFCHGKDGE